MDNGGSWFELITDETIDFLRSIRNSLLASDFKLNVVDYFQELAKFQYSRGKS
ncbi:MAG: hypothetical protein ACW99A_12320 [Candidatus Kariarchaeaceae archaeon]